MKLELDRRTDTLTVLFKRGTVAQQDDRGNGLILDYDAAGNLLSIEMRDASKRVDEPSTVTFNTRS